MYRERCVERQLLCLSGYITSLWNRALGLCVLVLMWAPFIGCVCVFWGGVVRRRRKMPNMPPVLCCACCLAFVTQLSQASVGMLCICVCAHKVCVHLPSHLPVLVCCNCINWCSYVRLILWSVSVLMCAPVSGPLSGFLRQLKVRWLD